MAKMWNICNRTRSVFEKRHTEGLQEVIVFFDKCQHEKAPSTIQVDRVNQLEILKIIEKDKK